MFLPLTSFRTLSPAGVYPELAEGKAGLAFSTLNFAFCTLNSLLKSRSPQLTSPATSGGVLP